MASATDSTSEARISAVREFNRRYTSLIGLLEEGLLSTPYSLTEARVIYELGRRKTTTELAGLRGELRVDAGYLSRVLSRLESAGLLERERLKEDRRRQALSLTAAGRSAYAMLDRRSAEEIGTLLRSLTEDQQRRLVGAMATIEQLLGEPPRDEALVLRAPGPGELGWIVQRHGALYATEYEWDQHFEALVARIVADFTERLDPRRESAWIAELGGEPVGCVLCVAQSREVAQLRLLLVEPRARGRGIGTRLVEECRRFAARAGYERIVLWTNDVLEDARRIYERAGFELTRSEPHESFGRPAVGQTWERTL